jgi:RNA polymerase sigma-70 factor (ECF subfamily)
LSDIERNALVKALIHRLQQGDKQALQMLYDETSSKLLAIVLRIVNDKSEAEDVLQEIFIKLWQKADKYSGSGSAWGWLCVSTRNAALDRLRKLQRHPQLSSDEDESLLDDLVKNCQSNDNHAINHCLHELKQDMRQCVLYAYIHGYSHNELAEKLSAPLGTVKAWVRRGLQELKLCLEA